MKSSKQNSERKSIWFLIYRRFKKFLWFFIDEKMFVALCINIMWLKSLMIVLVQYGISQNNFFFFPIFEGLRPIFVYLFLSFVEFITHRLLLRAKKNCIPTPSVLRYIDLLWKGCLYYQKKYESNYWYQLILTYKIRFVVNKSKFQCQYIA